jgi:hypothetical protein
VSDSGRISLLGKHEVSLAEDDMVLHRRTGPLFHSQTGCGS